MANENNGLYEFGPFRLDTAQRLLLRDDCPVALQPKAFDTLLMLVRNSEKWF
jgi:DNA-binding winged helix-turn-helix (wHTH) protein